MPTFIVLLRGINVRGTRKLPMAELEQCYEARRHDPRTRHVGPGLSGRLETLY